MANLVVYFICGRACSEGWSDQGFCLVLLFSSQNKMDLVDKKNIIDIRKTMVSLFDAGALQLTVQLKAQKKNLKDEPKSHA